MQSLINTNFKNRRTVFAISLLAYVVLFVVIGKKEGHGAILAILPVLGAAFCWGWRAGLAAGLCAFPVNMFMMTVIGLDWKPGMLTSVSAIGHSTFVLLGFFMGYMRELYFQRQQANERLQQEIAWRVQDMDTLRTMERRLETIIHESVDAIFITTVMLYNITMANRAFLELVGCTSEQVTGRSILDFIPEAGYRYTDDIGQEQVIGEQMHAALIEKIMELSETGHASNMEFSIRHSSGRCIPVEANVAFFYTGQEEQQEGTVAIVRDISHRKAAELRLQQEIAERARNFEALRSARERLAIIIEQSGDSIFISESMDMTFQMCNKAFCDLVGFDRAALTGESIFNLLPIIGQRYTTIMGDEIFIDDAFYEKSRPLMGQLHEQGMISNWDLFFVNSDHKLVPVELNIKYMYNEQQEFVAAVSMVRDITQRKLFERELQEAKSFLENIIENSLDGIIISDATGHIISVNRACEELMGHTRDELAGLSPAAFAFFDEGWYETTQGERIWVGMTDMMAAYSRMDVFFKEGKITNYNFYIKRKDDRLVEVEANISMLYGQTGQPIGSVSIMRDITARRRMEHELVRQRDQLAAANRELESFSYSVSHDLRAPLRSISGFSSALGEDFGHVLPAEGRRYLDRIQAGSARMGHLIDDLLKLSRLTRYDMRREQVSLSELAAEITAQFREQERGRDVSCTIEPGLVALGDGHLLRIAVENLLGNAWKYTGTRPHAEIYFGTAAEGYGDAAEHARGATVYYVRDNGVGFDMAYADKLFGAFQRLHAEREFPGTGIGLATVQRIVHRHGGRIWAESTPEAGATFYFTLTQEGS